ncbi:MAG TPA: hypothetical protein VE422_01195, partial [Terriglobia bacterium]|nr:hypothetical protein [Terriglobia bacterium]
MRQAARTEHILAAARAVLAGALLVAIYFDPATPVRNGVMAYTVLLTYACLSFAFFIWVRRRPIQSGIVPIVHALDFLAVVLISIFTHGPESLVYVCFTFVVLAAANRWGLL